MDSKYFIIGDENRRMVDMTKYKSQTAAFFDNLDEQSPSRPKNRRASTESSDSTNDLDGQTFIKTEKKLPDNSVVAINRDRLKKQSYSSLDQRSNMHDIDVLAQSLDYRLSKPYEASALARPDPNRVSRIPLSQSMDARHSQPFAFSKGIVSRHNKTNKILISESGDKNAYSQQQQESYTPRFELKRRDVRESMSFEKKPQTRFDFSNEGNYADGPEQRSSKLSMAKQSGFDKFEMTLYMSDQDAVTDEFICVKCRKKLLLSKYYIHKAVCSSYKN